MIRSVVVALALGCIAVVAHAQTDPVIGQRVDSRRGFSGAVPVDAGLDSARSGWSPTGMFERRVYVIRGAGEIRFIVTVKPTTVPTNAVVNEAYTYVNSDSATSSGTAYIRTYYLPTRSVRIELLPQTLRMRKYVEMREMIFSAFRWKPGANTDMISTDRTTPVPLPFPTQGP
jgi:hypothetical protein